MLYRRFILIVTLLLLAACSAPRAGVSKPFKVRSGQALLTTFLTTSGAAEAAGQILIEEIALEVNDVWIGLGLRSGEIDYQQQKGQPLLIGTVAAPLGEHRRLRLKISGLAGKQELQTFIVSLPDPLDLRAGNSKCLFIDWQLFTDRPGGAELLPRFTAWGQGQTLGGELLYVACRDLNTIYVVRMDINEVVASFGVPGPLAEIRIHQRKLYILSTGKRSIFVYDCLSGRLIDQIALPGTISPQHMTLSDDGAFAFITDASSGEVLKLDLDTGTLVARRLIGHKPQRLIFFDDGEQRLAVTAPNSQQVFILDAVTLQLDLMIPVGRRPVSLLFFDRALYVVEQGTGLVAVFDPRTGKQKIKIPVGFRPEYLLAVDANTAYVSNSGEASLSALYAGQNMALRKIPAGKAPTEWLESQRKRLLYIANSSTRRVTVVDHTAENFLKEIHLGGAPTSLAILE